MTRPERRADMTAGEPIPISANRIRTVLFDLGNVLVYFEPDRFWETFGQLDGAFKERVGPAILELGKSYESGSLSTPAFWETFRSMFDASFSDEHLRNAFASVLPRAVEGMENLVKSVARTHQIAVVSNTSPVHFRQCIETYPVLRYFSRFYVSYELRTLKPSKDFYNAVIKGEDCEPGRMVFIDDLEVNVEGATAAGMKGIVFRGTEALQRSLEEMGILKATVREKT